MPEVVPFMVSGAIYSGVPIISPGREILEPLNSFAMPKSAMVTLLSFPNNILLGLMSLCIIPLSCAVYSASAISIDTLTVR